MSGKSAIEWTDATWNPVTGCSKVSPGCANCYAETISLRFGHSVKPWTPENAAENVVLHPDRLDQPLKWRAPRMVFVNSMSDLFHEEIPADFIWRVFDIMRLAERHTFQVLTKRPERAAKAISAYYRYTTNRNPLGGEVEVEYPLRNVWLGVSIENSRFTWRADVLREVPAAVRFISAEPLLGSLFEWDRSVPFNARAKENRTLGGAIGDYLPSKIKRPLDLTGIDWLIVGGESGLGHRPMREEWALELRDQARASGAAFFFKQWGGRTPKSGGRLLQGREWNEMPNALNTDDCDSGRLQDSLFPVATKEEPS